MLETTNRSQEALNQLELGIKQLVESGNWRAYLKMQSRFHNYSFNNTLLILFQRPTATRIAGFRTWKQLGRSVRKGEKTIWILAPITYKPQQAEEATEQNGVQVLRGFKSVPVFDISQTDGEPLLEAPLKKLEGEDQGLFVALRQFSECLGWSVVVRPLDHSNGYCHFGSRHIAIDSRLSPLHQAKTLAHEVAHSLMHSLEDYQMHRADQELEAESVAFCVLNYFGLDSQDYSFGYVAGWQGGKDAIAQLKQSGKRIQATTQQIIAGLAAFSLTPTSSQRP